MDARDPVRVKLTEQLLEKLYNMGVIPGKTSMSLCDKLSTSSFCRCEPVHHTSPHTRCHSASRPRSRKNFHVPTDCFFPRSRPPPPTPAVAASPS